MGLMRRKMIGLYLAADPKVCHGKLTFSGTRVPVKTVLHFLARGKTVESILKDWPELNREAVEEAVELAAVALDEKFTVQAGR